ncbi:MAG TPA: mycofactocin precursor MftA [Nocardioides sp.]|nr:mycofactocin precursor MftA [Nocardioides sp.]
MGPEQTDVTTDQAVDQSTGQAAGTAEESLIEEVSIDGMCGVY